MRHRSKIALGLVGLLALGGTRSVLGVVRPTEVAQGGQGGSPISAAVQHALEAVQRAGVAPGSISGTVRDDRGRPIPDAQACAAAFPADVREEPACAATDRAGAYTIGGLPGRVYQLTAMAPRFAFGTYESAEHQIALGLEVGQHLRGYDFVLRAGAEVSGTVRDAGGGVVAHASVGVETRLPSGRLSTAIVSADDDGRYTAWTAVGPINVTASADGYASASRGGDAPAWLDLALTPTASLSGVVLDAHGDPVADANVYAVHNDPGAAFSDELVSTDAEGRFTVSRIEPGRYQVRATAMHGIGISATSARVGLGQHVTGVVVRLRDAYTVSGPVAIAPTGAPCPGGWIRLVDAERDQFASLTIDADGKAHDDSVLPGRYTSELHCDDYLPRPSAPVVVVDRDVTARWEVVEAGSIIGTVRDASGAPIERADVTVESAHTTPPVSTSSQTVTTDEQGNYELHGMEPAHYTLRAQRPVPHLQTTGDAPELAELDLTGHETARRDLVLKPAGGEVTGQVTTTAGPMTGPVTVDLRDAAGTTIASAATDDAGRFVLREVPPAAYRVQVHRSAARRGDVRNVPATGLALEVRADRPATIAPVIEVPSGRISGRVIDGDGQPIGDAFVQLAIEAKPDAEILDARRDEQPILVGDDGRFAATELGAGRYTVRAYRKGGLEVVQAHVELGSELTLRLVGAASLTVVAHRDGAPLDRAEVELRDVHEDVVRIEQFGHPGPFELEDLTPGRYHVVVSSADTQQTVEVELAPGRRASVDVALASYVTVVGRAIDLHTRRPVSGLEVSGFFVESSRWAAQPDDLRNITGADGRFALPRVPRGTLELRGIDRTSIAGVALIGIPVHRTVPARGPAVVDIGDIPVLTYAAAAVYGDPGLTLADARITAVVPDGPAARAGLVAGDVITSVAGFATTGLDAPHVSELLRGPVGAKLAITVARGATVTLVL